MPVRRGVASAAGRRAHPRLVSGAAISGPGRERAASRSATAAGSPPAWLSSTKLLTASVRLAVLLPGAELDNGNHRRPLRGAIDLTNSCRELSFVSASGA